ncbi:PhoU family transcriptional regulator [Candidatus Bathyarchaeota archaeon]|nr:PhoU family transcriptional regulator [Candidatus Bathyarchaeota archaeon]
MSEADLRHWERITSDLVTLKNTSEMMIDLAYSAVLLNNRYLAEEVQSLEEEMDKLHIEFQCRVLSRTEEEVDPRDLLGIIRMGNVTERIADAASEIAEVVLRGIEPHPILQMVIQDAEETVEKVTVTENAPVAGKTIREARIADETGMWVLYIRRGTRWMKPKPSTVLLPGDMVIASGYSDGEEDFKQLLTGAVEQ